jgi:phosphatidylglycerophosphate synthase
MLRGQRTFPPTLAGKASTICQVFLMYYVLYLNAVGRSPESLGWLYVLTALLTAVSWVQYGFISVRMLRRDRVPPAR